MIQTEVILRSTDVASRQLRKNSGKLARAKFHEYIKRLAPQASYVVLETMFQEFDSEEPGASAYYLVTFTINQQDLWQALENTDDRGC